MYMIISIRGCNLLSFVIAAGNQFILYKSNNKNEDQNLSHSKNRNLKICKSSNDDHHSYFLGNGSHLQINKFDNNPIQLS